MLCSLIIFQWLLFLLFLLFFSFAPCIVFLKSLFFFFCFLALTSFQLELASNVWWSFTAPIWQWGIKKNVFKWSFPTGRLPGTGIFTGGSLNVCIYRFFSPLSRSIFSGEVPSTCARQGQYKLPSVSNSLPERVGWKSHFCLYSCFRWGSLSSALLIAPDFIVFFKFTFSRDQTALYLQRWEAVMWLYDTVRGVWELWRSNYPMHKVLTSIFNPIFLGVFGAYLFASC